MCSFAVSAMEWGNQFALIGLDLHDKHRILVPGTSECTNNKQSVPYYRPTISHWHTLGNYYYWSTGGSPSTTRSPNKSPTTTTKSQGEKAAMIQLVHQTLVPFVPSEQCSRVPFIIVQQGSLTETGSGDPCSGATIALPPHLSRAANICFKSCSNSGQFVCGHNNKIELSLYI